MNRSNLRAAWDAGQPAINGWLAIPSILSVDAIARAGWTTLTVDLQHGTADYAQMLTMLPAIEAAGITPMVRVPWNEPSIVMRALDAGVMGVICPMIAAPDAARAFVRACQYPPAGNRSFGPVRARLVHGDGYPAVANDEVVPIAMIETRAALDHVDEIAAIPGMGALYIGPSDLSSNLGFGPGFDRTEDEMLAHIARIRQAAHGAGIKACIHCASPTYAAGKVKEGFDRVTIGSDARFAEAGAKAAVATFQSELG